jgi:anti-sigma factor RsiW
MSNEDDMQCREVVEVVTGYLEGTMPVHDRERFEAHLQDCPYCVEYVEQMRTTIDVLGGIGPESIGPELQAELLHAFRDWRQAG